MARRGRGRSSSYYNDYGYPPYVSVAERQAKARAEATKLGKKGRDLSPVHIEGRTIARTFWGKAWCTNLESYSDYSNRLPRGRSYVKNGLVLDLQIEPGQISSVVSGTRVYKVEISITRLPEARWKAIIDKCSGEIDSVVELLRGNLSKGVMQIISQKGEGLFPAPKEIKLSCSCPDWAVMCKHVAATLYGVGARLDHEPALLFRLRQVDETELIRSAGEIAVTGQGEEAIAEDDLSDLFGIELDGDQGVPGPAPKPKAPKARAAPPAKTPARKSTTSSPVKAKDQAVKRARKGKKPAPKTSLVPASGGRISSKELIDKGISRSRLQSWLQTGVLVYSGDRGVYLTTDRTEEKVRSFLDE